MSLHIADHCIYRDAWSSPALRALFEDVAQVAGWIEIMAALAETQAEFGLIPPGEAAQLATACRSLTLDEAFFAEAREDYARTHHSLLGLIRALQRRCPGQAGEWLCYGATVQDITDTHTARCLTQARELFLARLNALADRLAALARRYRDAPMCGRTHGQPGLPITFGFKAAGWLDEILRHRQRMKELGDRIEVGQLAGGVGSLSSFGDQALALQRRFLERLGLRAPAIAWTAARDRLAEWLNLLALMAATADRIGHEVYNLQRPEIGELSEGFAPDAVGSITMPQKRNPEIAEHLGTLDRLVRQQAAGMLENLVHDHERDGRSWKGEWAILPAGTLAAGKALDLLQELLDHLEVRAERMRENLQATQGAVQGERVMLALAPQLGKQTAHALVHRVAMAAAEQGLGLRDALLREPVIASRLGEAGLTALLDMEESGCCGAMVDQVLAAASEQASDDGAD